MKEAIRQAYAMTSATEFFRNINKESILKLYTELDYVYNLLKSLGIVDVYSKNEILKEFNVDWDMGGNPILVTEGKSKEIDTVQLANAIFSHFKQV